MTDQAAEQAHEIDLSFVVIGLNEGPHLGDCLASVKHADLTGLTTELIYVDGGSTDDSLEIARAAGADHLLGGERRRKAAENRNLGLAHARGRHVQFLDGDMIMAPDWPKAALTVLAREEGCAAVCGVLLERNRSATYRALQLDWENPEGRVAYCGGAALWRRSTVAGLGGFPEDVAYGEEPYLCWRVRNELGQMIWHLPRTMALHDLAYKGFADYWRRSARAGETYAEIAARCRGTRDPLWSDAVRSNLLWAGIYLAGFIWLFAAPAPLRGIPVALMIIVLARKTAQMLRRNIPPTVAVIYALHTYFAKANIAYGILRWHLRRR